MFHRRIHGPIAASVIAVLACCDARADLPLVARKFLHGDAHVVIMGDSEQNGLLGLYPSTWQIDKWSGLVGGANYDSSFNGETGAYTFGFTAPYIASTTEELANTTNPV